jgi:hypothetical protein
MFTKGKISKNTEMIMYIHIQVNSMTRTQELNVLKKDRATRKAHTRARKSRAENMKNKINKEGRLIINATPTRPGNKNQWQRSQRDR